MFLAKVFGKLRKVNLSTREQDGNPEESDGQEKSDVTFTDLE
jgi:hypothetical protein